MTRKILVLGGINLGKILKKVSLKDTYFHQQKNRHKEVRKLEAFIRKIKLT